MARAKAFRLPLMRKMAQGNAGKKPGAAATFHAGHPGRSCQAKAPEHLSAALFAGYLEVILKVGISVVLEVISTVNLDSVFHFAGRSFTLAGGSVDLSSL